MTTNHTTMISKMEENYQLQNGDTPSPPPNAWRESSDPLSDPEEQRVLFSTLDSFRQYRRNAHYTTTHRRRQNLYALPQEQLKILTSPPLSLLDKLSEVDDAVDINADIADAILARGLTSFGVPPDPISTREPHPGPSWHDTADNEQHSKAHSTIRQFYRDWTSEGFHAEVKPLLDIILSGLSNNGLPPSPKSHILLPGAGLGRMLFEFILAGYSATGNEISYHQLLASDFILNSTPSANSYTLYPFTANFSNNLTRLHQLRAYTIPDIHPAAALAQAHTSGFPVGEMGMAAGDFITSFSPSDPASSAASFSAVVTLYFIDTAPNLIRYIETIHHCLKTNGLWVNIGPLLWHFDNQQAKDKQHQHQHQHDGHGGWEPADEGTGSEEGSPEAASPKLEDGSMAVPSPSPPDRAPPLTAKLQKVSPKHQPAKDSGIAEPGSFELADDEVKALIERFGFVIEDQKLLPESVGGYIQDPDSMLQNRYRNSYWVARKVEKNADEDEDTYGTNEDICM